MCVGGGGGGDGRMLGKGATVKLFISASKKEFTLKGKGANSFLLE